MKVIKRSGQEVQFDSSKIRNAIAKANDSVDESFNKLTDKQIDSIVEKVISEAESLKRACSVEEIQDMVEKELMQIGAYVLAKNYITYRYKRALIRKANTTDQQILSLIDRNNEEVKQENSNKNPIINSVQRDYMAGEVSKDLCKRFLVPEDVIKAHEEGILHFHDSDYFAQR